MVQREDNERQCNNKLEQSEDKRVARQREGSTVRGQCKDKRVARQENERAAQQEATLQPAGAR